MKEHGKINLLVLYEILMILILNIKQMSYLTEFIENRNDINIKHDIVKIEY